ncbi:spermidine/putrescine ABC transporter substrate-binding protein [Candidatus Mycoplasma haematobovis]|uniref:Spermidine/putrescine ABC transporter substrate-binding protein n=1 Tax=Candidatus Mycoplasma haematobovis TaxID=432608 RepID=A0A1A9QE58_9MOLU|nr:spermidine/putrescine ABC transporter substrate-binding protein [Candidatus Mycoplasma haematobovis]OAL10236.1 spermidine/putrescine ABC transporter substrate-binding protein [Candidatus Mycoplasma haematobovis]
MIKKLVAGLSVWVTASSGLLLGKAGSSNDLVFGNYSDYISSDVAQELRKKYKLRVDLFDYDHLVKERFQKGIYDIAVVSTSVLSELKSSGVAMKLDWSILLKEEDNVGGSGNTSSEQKTSKDAVGLFTDIVQYMSKDLLDYGIPYFVQKLGFYYRGEKIKDLQEPVTFKTLIEKISNDNRFHSKNGKAQLGLIDDPRTVLSLARKVKGHEDVNPSDNEYKTSDSILNDYKTLITSGLSRNKLGENFLYMTPDSGPLVDALSSGDIQGAFMYNGDGLFAAEGGNAELDMEGDKFHYVKLSENIFFLDFLTFSAKMTEHKKTNAYKMAKELLFITNKNKDNPFKEKSKLSSESEGDDGKEYEEMAVRNFNDVLYTPTLKSVYEKLKNCYFKDEDEKKSINATTKHEILKVEKSENHSIDKEFEKQLDAQKKSDMLIAYSNFKLLV